MSSDWYRDPNDVLAALRRAEKGKPQRSRPKIGGYSDLVELARGGQGVVYTAVQDSTRRRVAIKLLGPQADDDERARRRFEREIDMVARLRHPGIVRLYDSGSTAEGRLYCVMDFIEGVPLDEFLNGGRLPAAESGGKGLSEAATLELFHTITLAVKHAHQRGVIHRDLKPSNIRVDGEGRPHVLDFGLAKVIGREARGLASVTGQGGGFAGSLPWASPEQVEGDPAELDTRTDVYSIGVMLYHAVTGAFPYDVQGPVRDVLNAIVEQEPQSVRALRPEVGRDLAAVIAKCLEKDKDRRYDSAAELGEDLRRILHDEPILAQADSRWYTIRRSVRRYRVALSLAVVALVGLVAFSAAMSFLYQRAKRAEERTVHARRRTESVNDFLESMLASASPLNLGREVTVQQMISQASTDLEQDETLPPLVRANLHSVVANTWSALANYAPALEHARRAVAIATDEIGPHAPATLEYRNIEGSILISQSRYYEAQAAVESTLADAREALGEEDPTTLAAWANLAHVRSESGDFEEAIEINGRVWRARSRLLGEEHPQTISALRHLAVEESWAGRFEDSRAHYEIAAQKIERVHGPDHPDAILIRSSLAVTIRQLGDAAGAEAMLRELLPRAEAVLGPDHRDTNIIKSNLAYALGELGRFEEDLALTAEVYESSLEHLGATHTDTLNAMNGVARALHELGRFEESVLLLEDAYGLSLETFGPLHFRSLDSGANLAQALQRLGRLEEASAVAIESLEHAREFYDHEPHVDLAWFTKVAGDIEAGRGELELAISLLAESYELSKLEGGQDTHAALTALTRAYLASGRAQEARTVLEDRLEELADSGAEGDRIHEVQDLLASIAQH